MAVRTLFITARSLFIIKKNQSALAIGRFPSFCCNSFRLSMLQGICSYRVVLSTIEVAWSAVLLPGGNTFKNVGNGV
jgi:hypothetical protein